MAGDTGFQFKYNLAGRTSGIQRSFTIANSATITVGDMVKLTSGYIALADATYPIMGCVVGLTNKVGIDLTNNKTSLTGSGASYTRSTRTVVAGSDNTATDELKAIVDIDPFSVWSAEPDGTFGTDTQGDLPGCYTDITAASDQPDEDVAETGKAQLFIWGVDPEDSTRGLYSIAQHQLSGDTAT